MSEVLAYEHRCVLVVKINKCSLHFLECASSNDKGNNHAVVFRPQIMQFVLFWKRHCHPHPNNRCRDIANFSRVKRKKKVNKLVLLYMRQQQPMRNSFEKHKLCWLLFKYKYKIMKKYRSCFSYTSLSLYIYIPYCLFLM